MGAEPEVDVIDGRFEVGEVIGRGAMGEVRRGRDLRLGRDVAIKFLRRDLAADEGVRARFEDEARAAARLSHPAIVTVFDSGEWEQVPYLVMECLPGRTLADELGEAPVAAERVRAIATDIAGALETAHSVGVVHRDVKPGNILITEDGRAKLADFGIAKSTEALDHTMTGMIVGTPAYLAPERLGGEPATPRSDLYSLGVVLYEALTGDKPFSGDSPVAFAHAIHTTTPRPLLERLPDIDPTLAGAVDRAMSREPGARQTSAGALVAELTADIQTTPTELTAKNPTATAAMPALTQPRRVSIPAVDGWWRQRTPAERRGAVAIAVGVIVVLLVFLMARDDGGGSETPPTTAPPAAETTELPRPLDDAIVELEERVRP